MKVEAERFSFSEVDSSLGLASSLPYLPFILSYQDRSVTLSGLLDTGSTVNVLPYDIGIELGAVWERQTIPVQLTGNLAKLEARVLMLSGLVGSFAPVRLAFAWTKAPDIPLILGQVNFFLEFDVCFFRSQLAFEVKPKPTV